MTNRRAAGKGPRSEDTRGQTKTRRTVPTPIVFAPRGQGLSLDCSPVPRLPKEISAQLVILRQILVFSRHGCGGAALINLFKCSLIVV
jgi:hypothetical protein